MQFFKQPRFRPLHHHLQFGPHYCGHRGDRGLHVAADDRQHTFLFAVSPSVLIYERFRVLSRFLPPTQSAVAKSIHHKQYRLVQKRGCSRAETFSQLSTLSFTQPCTVGKIWGRSILILRVSLFATSRPLFCFERVCVAQTDVYTSARLYGPRM